MSDSNTSSDSIEEVEVYSSLDTSESSVIADTPPRGTRTPEKRKTGNKAGLASPRTTTPVKAATPIKEVKVVLERLNGISTPTKVDGKPPPPPEEIPSSSSSPPTPSRSSSSRASNSSFSSQSPEKIKRGVTCRMTQYKLLKAMFGDNKHHKLPGALFLWGTFATGKCHTLESVLSEPECEDIVQIKIHCAEILCGRRAFFETFLKQLLHSRNIPIAANFKCDSLRSLYENINDFLEHELVPKNLRIVAIIQGAQTLKDEDEDILQFFSRLRDICNAQICVAFLSSLPPTLFMPTIMDHVFIPIHFPQYTSEELTEVLKEGKIVRCRSHRSGSYYEFYVKMIVSMFYPVCRDIRKLSRLVKAGWESFEKKVEEAGADVNLTRLWKSIEPQLKTQFFEMNTTLVCSGLDGANSHQNQENFGKFQNLPLNAKYLVIASYLATHNPPSSDKRFFVKTGVSKAKKSKKIAKTDSTNAFLRTFELNRLMAIFSAIQQNYNDKAVNTNRSVGFMSLITTLCQNKLLQHIGEDSVGNVKYKCLLDYDAVLDISRAVGFELNNYLYHLI